MTEDGRSGHVTRKGRIRYTGIWREKLKERERQPESPRGWRKLNISRDLKETSCMTFNGFV
jgi:hypothetical protein